MLSKKEPGTANTITQRSCWCGNSQLIQFSDDYAHCANCTTLVSQVGLSDEKLVVRSDDDDFYGRQYWFAHQEKDLGFANITRRARLDLPERCLHWLRAVLKYKRPPGKVLELGSAHGGFVALLQWAGFEATGLELSSWVVDFARSTFHVPMLLGPVESQPLETGSLDAIALMDVLEHLPNPVDTMRHCLNLLKPDGVLVIQTPCYPAAKTYDAMLEASDPFLEQLKSNEHLYLFNQSSVRKLFHTLGISDLVFEPAIFGHYDMFLIVSKAPLQINSIDTVEQSLSDTASGRLVQALIDADNHRVDLEERLSFAEVDRAARLDLINRQDRELKRLPQLEAEIANLQAQLAGSEADRAARLEVINQLSGYLQASEADRAARLKVIEDLKAQLAGLADETTRPSLLRPRKERH